jgi:hypothetical protein
MERPGRSCSSSGSQSIPDLVQRPLEDMEDPALDNLLWRLHSEPDLLAVCMHEGCARMAAWSEQPAAASPAAPCRQSPALRSCPQGLIAHILPGRRGSLNGSLVKQSGVACAGLACGSPARCMVTPSLGAYAAPRVPS